jgi:DnaK suppressor protein
MKHLNAADRDALARQLALMKSQALKELRETAPGIDGSSSDGAHDVRSHADEAEIMRQNDVRLAQIEVDRQGLSEIEQPHQHMAEARYGICAGCGEDIPRERLLAQPTAIRCAACQAAGERAQRR